MSENLCLFLTSPAKSKTYTKRNLFICKAEIPSFKIAELADDTTLFSNENYSICNVITFTERFKESIDELREKAEK